MAFERFLVAALALAVASSHPVESERNRSDQPLWEATDRILEDNGARRHAAAIEKGINAAAVAADSSHDTSENGSGRTKRGFSLWTGGQPQLTGYQRFSMWRPPVYQLTRPYYIPVYGSPGRHPMYFPPQSLNPGTPMDNPLPNRPYSGPPYLPPKEYLPSPTTTDTPMNITDRFLFDDEEEDDRPVWGTVPSTTTTTTTTSRPTNIPTRPPRPPVMTDFPPLVHSSDTTNQLSAENAPLGKSDSDMLVQPSRKVVSTTRRPSSGLSDCVWAIISCCSVTSTDVPENCFAQRGCPGPFWGTSPCDSDNARAAMEAALNFYNE